MSELRGMTALIRRGLQEHKGEVTWEHIRDAVEVLGGYKPTQKQIAQAMSYLIRTEQVPFAPIGRGKGVWVRYVSSAPRITGETMRVATIVPPKPTPRPALYEQVGTASDGRPIARGEDGVLYALMPL